MSHQTPIRVSIEKVAAKLKAIQDGDYPDLFEQITRQPRYIELLAFLQKKSMERGSLPKFAADLIEQSPEHVGTPTLCQQKGRTLTLSQKVEAWKEMDGGRPHIDFGPPHYGEPEDLYSVGDEVERMSAPDRAKLLTALKGVSDDALLEGCRKDALRKLPKYLHALCVNPELSFGSKNFTEVRSEPAPKRGEYKPAPSTCEINSFQDIEGAIFEFMDREAEAARAALAPTEITKKIWESMDYSYSEKVMVWVHTDSRFGKSETAKGYCAANPGRARWFQVPSDGSMKCLLMDMAKSLGIEVGCSCSPAVLRYRIKFVQEQLGFLLVVDEAHYLIPPNYTKSSSPMRLNWVRELVDMDLPIAIMTTPQSWEALSRFERKTQYAMEQFFGRNFLTVAISGKMAEEDVLAVARLNFPEMSDGTIGTVVEEARLSRGYLQFIKSVATRARYLARESGRAMKAADVKAAVADYKGSSLPLAGPDAAAVEPDKTPESGRGLKPHLRGVKPRSREPVTAEFPTCSLRGADPELRVPELVPADS
jgi:hypothetical protein